MRRCCRSPQALRPETRPDRFQEKLARWTIYQYLDVGSDAMIRQPAVTRLETSVDPDGQNLISVLHTLYTGNRDFKKDINSAMKAAFGADFEELTSPGGRPTDSASHPMEELEPRAVGRRTLRRHSPFPLPLDGPRRARPGLVGGHRRARDGAEHPWMLPIVAGLPSMRPCAPRSSSRRTRPSSSTHFRRLCQRQRSLSRSTAKHDSGRLRVRRSPTGSGTTRLAHSSGAGNWRT